MTKPKERKTLLRKTANKEEESPPSLETKDYFKIALDYAKEAVADTKRLKFNRWIRKAAERFLGDLERAKKKDSPFYFDPWYSNDACDFLEKLPHVEGKWDTENVVLHASHVFFVVQLFGFRNQDGTRRFTTALFAVARKNAKSFLCSGILLYCYCCEEEEGPQVVSAATTGSQARIVFNVAKRIVEKTRDLREHFGLECYTNAITRFEVGGTFRPINAKASTQDGLNPSHCGIDEVHAHKTHDLLNVLKSAAGARRNPLFLYTTTEGYENPGPWSEIRHFAHQLLSGVLEADHFLAVYYSLDVDNKEENIVADDDFDESTWIKANPLMEVNPLLIKEIRKEAIEAKSMPGRHAEFKIKRLNKSSSVVGGWVNLLLWKECTGQLDLTKLKDVPCWGGLDLANTRDIGSFRLVWNVDGVYHTYGWRFVPRTAIKYRTERGMVPYEAWVKSGHLIEAGDEAIDYDEIEQVILKAVATYNVQLIGYDSWNAQQLVQKLSKAEVPLREFIQGTKSYHPAMQALERAYVKKNLVHGNDPVLNWNAANLVARTDVNMNTAPDKKRVVDKIDDIVALLMAIGTMINVDDGEEKEFQMFFI
jgi:phage terminase large subunit-like protein